MADTTLDQAIKDAEKELTKLEVPPAGEEKPEIKVDASETPESESETDDETEDELTEEQKEESIRLYRALNNPKTASAVVAALAAQAGILGKPEQVPETKTEIKATKKAITDIFKEALGTEYAFLSDKISKGIEAVIEQERTEQTARFSEIQAKDYEREVQSVWTKLNTETKGEFKKFEARVAELSDEIPVGKMDPETYIRRLYTIASGEKSQVSPKKIADTIRRNANDAPSRLRATSAPAQVIAMPDKKMDINESVSFALEQLTKQGK